MYVDDLQLLGISMISKLISTAFVGAWGEAPGAGGWRQGLCGLELAGTTCLSNGWRGGGGGVGAGGYGAENWGLWAVD